MNDDTNSFTRLFALWSCPSKPIASGLSRDMCVPYRRAAQWVARGFLPPWYWLQFIHVLRLRFDLNVTSDDLVEASAEMQARVIGGARKAAEARRRARVGGNQGRAL